MPQVDWSIALSLHHNSTGHCLSVSILCSFMRDPSHDCYAAALNLLQYAQNTKQKSLHYTGSAKLPAGGNLLICGMLNRLRKRGGLIAYSDATRYRGNELGHNSYGYVICIFGAPIAYAAKSLKLIRAVFSRSRICRCFAYVPRSTIH